MSKVELSDWYEQEYPEHSRTSCSDEHPINADVTGHGCWRCNAIIFTEHESIRAQLKEAQRQRDELVKALEKAREEMSCANFNSAAERIDHALASVKGGAA